MALFAACMQARDRVVKMLTDYLESRPVKDDIYNKFIQTICEDSPEDTEEMFHGQGRDLLTGLLFEGHNTTVDTMVFTVKYVGENPHVLTEIWVIPSPSACSYHKIHYSSSSCHGFNCSGFRV
jgi:cytochrome P450